MNYYIDFDNTLYETSKLTKIMIKSICDIVCENTGVEYNIVNDYFNNNFNSSSGNIYKFCEGIEKEFKVDSKELLNKIDEILNNGRSLVFDDAISFVKKLKDEKNELYILTFIPEINHEFQMKKIIGSQIAQYFDGIIITTKNKYDLNLNYEKGIFIDDDPKNLIELLNKKPIRVIRIRKPNNKRSNIDIDNPKIEEYENFTDIII